MRKIFMIMAMAAFLPACDSLASEEFRDFNPVPPGADPLKAVRENSPNYGRGYIQNSLDINGLRQDPYHPESDMPHGSDIRDFNPYYNRDGSLKDSK